MRLVHGLAALWLAMATTAIPVYAQDAQVSNTTAAAAGAVAGAVIDHVVTTQSGQKIDCKNIDITSLSQTDIQHIQDACAALTPKQDSSATANITPDTVAQWAALAKEFGSAIGATAKELGIAVNDFLRTPAGVLLTLYLFWHKLGGVLIGVPFLITVWAAYYKIWDRWRRTPSKTENRPVLFGIFNRVIATEYEYNQGDEPQWFAIWGGLVTTIISAFIIGMIIL